MTKHDSLKCDDVRVVEFPQMADIYLFEMFHLLDSNFLSAIFTVEDSTLSTAAEPS